MASSPQDYGRYSIASAKLRLIPQFDPKATSGSSVRLVPPTSEQTNALPVPVLSDESDETAIANAYGAATVKKLKVQPSVFTSVSGIGVMDVGQGNCNMLIANAPLSGGGADVIAYYDVGYPLWFYANTLPNTMRFGNAQYRGPIPNNQNGNLSVVLSHWDWDHWRLGRIAQLNNLAWTVPRQPFGPVAANFLNTIGNANTINAGGPPQIGPGNSWIYRCRPNPPYPVAMIINNTGLAMSVPVDLPSNIGVIYNYVLTGDANFDSVPLPPAVQNNITGIVAVHHGSNAHGAAQNLPAPVANPGRIAYSYGVGPNNGNHAYGFPVQQAVTAYQNAGWSRENSTAEGQNINNNGQAGRGNVQLGVNVALLAAYTNTAFANFPNQLNWP
jgi:hypothetical protein